MNDCKHETVEELNRRVIWREDNPIGTLIIGWCHACEFVIGHMQKEVPLKVDSSILKGGWIL